MDGSSDYLVQRQNAGYIVSIQIPPDCFDRICVLSQALGISFGHAAVLILRAGIASHDAIDAEDDAIEDTR